MEQMSTLKKNFMMSRTNQEKTLPGYNLIARRKFDPLQV